MAKIKIEKIAHHRNGISGEPFYVVLFKNGKDTMLATVFEDKGYVSVFDLTLLCNHVIEFAENSWRGDDFEPALREAIEKWEANRS